MWEETMDVEPRFAFLSHGGVRYAVFVPYLIGEASRLPTILFLHGAGETGMDGFRQTQVGLGRAIRNRERDFPFLTVFPQSQRGGWGATEGERAMAILDEVEKQYPLDRSRLYITGISMGGFGTWSLAAAFPNRWAAMAPVCGGGDARTAPLIRHVPCWCVHGREDDVVPVDHSRRMVEALRAAGGEPTYHEYPRVKHNSWDRAYADPALYEWLLSHQLAGAGDHRNSSQQPG
jgi:predicted peptidase